MSTIRAREDGQPGVVFSVHGIDHPLDEREARRLLNELRNHGSDAALQAAHKIEECLVAPIDRVRSADVG